jgi:hypothetical protein
MMKENVMNLKMFSYNIPKLQNLDNELTHTPAQAFARDQLLKRLVGHRAEAETKLCPRYCDPQ